MEIGLIDTKYNMIKNFKHLFWKLDPRKQSRIWLPFLENLLSLLLHLIIWLRY